MCTRTYTSSDCSAVTEIRQLFPDAPNLRPVDIFTVAALPGRMTALDIGICCPDACNGGSDYCDSMYCAKVAKYMPHLNPQREFEYRLLVFSCYGRVHPEACSILKTLVKGVARRHGVINFMRGLIVTLVSRFGGVRHPWCMILCRSYTIVRAIFCTVVTQ